MTDAALRASERAAAADPSPERQASYLRARLRAGELRWSDLRAAAILGSAAAALASDYTPPADRYPAEWVREFCAVASPRALAAVLLLAGRAAGTPPGPPEEETLWRLLETLSRSAECSNPDCGADGRDCDGTGPAWDYARAWAAIRPAAALILGDAPRD